MAKRNKTISCARCGRVEERCRRNPHTHVFCRHEDCVNERKRERQRKSYNGKYREDKDFAEAERKRCGGNLKARRIKEQVAVEQKSARPPPIAMDLALWGLLEKLTDADDATAVEESLRHFERRGQELAAFAPFSRGAPKQKTAKCSSTPV